MGLDHLIGRPSSAWKRFEVIMVLFTVLSMVRKYDNHPSRMPEILKRLNKFLRNFAPWQVVALTLLSSYVSNRFLLLIGLNPPELYAKHYNRNFYRATWVMTAMDAGFWTAMNLRPAPVRELGSILFTLYYLIFADQAEEKVRKLRSQVTVQMMRVSWEKSTSPILWFLTSLFRQRVQLVRDIWLDRQSVSQITHPNQQFPNWRSKTRAKLYYDGSLESLRCVNRIVLHFPGGGFVTMKPENHDDYLRLWSKSLGPEVAILSIDYGKAPEFPFPFAIEECFEIYKMLCSTNGHCIGVNLTSPQTDTGNSKYRRARILMAGDSAGGNLVATVCIRIIQQNQKFRRQNPHLFDPFGNLLLSDYKRNLLPKPDGLLIIYGALNFDMATWITPTSQQAVAASAGINLVPSSASSSANMADSEGREEATLNAGEGTVISDYSTSLARLNQNPSSSSIAMAGLPTPYLSITSRMSYFSDRIITPNFLSAMALLYLGQNSSANPLTDMLLSPVVAPDEILEEFPKVWIMCGECDPFVDDSVVFAARVRHAIAKKRERELEMTSVMEELEQQRRHMLRASARLQANSTSDSMGDGPGVSGDQVDNEKDSGDEEGMATDLEDEFAAEYGEINQDPSSYVTVKIYAGLSHAYLNMLMFLPEAKHAVKLCSMWLEEMFDEGEAMRRRRRARRAALAKRRFQVAIELRDEDNIPDSIQLPLGAEYRFSGGHSVQLREAGGSVNSVNSAAALTPARKRSQSARYRRHRPKYYIGDSSDEGAASDEEGVISIRGGAFEVHDDRAAPTADPMRDAVVDKRRSIRSRLSTSRENLRQHHRRQRSGSITPTSPGSGGSRSLTALQMTTTTPTPPPPQSQLKQNGKSSQHSPAVPQQIERSKPQKPSLTASAQRQHQRRPSQQFTDPEPGSADASGTGGGQGMMFLKENELVSKRRNVLVQDVYSGVDMAKLSTSAQNSDESTLDDYGNI